MWSHIAVVTLLCCVGLVTADDVPTCYGGGSIATAVILTIIIVLVLLAGGYIGWKKYGKHKKEKHLILETDPEKGGDFAFDNPGFKDPGLTPIGKVIEKTNVESSGKPKWSHWPALGALTTRNDKKKSLDDLALGEEVKIVALRSHDFTGLGFNIFGNMREGIYIKDVLHRGPASESGKLSPGDRITSITINFEHIVYEDALTILSYASPYEVIVQAKSGKLGANSAGSHVGQPGHPLYKSSSSTDLVHIGKSAKKRLFQADDNDSGLSYPSLQKTRSNAPTLERQNSPQQKNPNKKPNKSVLNQEQLKSQLEQTIIEDTKHNLKTKENHDKLKIESETQKTEQSFQKFGIKVLPVENKEQKSPKIAEQNDNNINIETDAEEIQRLRSIDEVDKKVAPPVKKRDKKPVEVEIVEESFDRGGILTSSGIRRDENGIPQEIPSHMMNAAVAARRNRRPSEENLEDPKTPKNRKGKAPAPPLELEDEDKLEELDATTKPIEMEKIKGYESDSDQEADNHSSVNTIELNSSDITIHQSEENEEKQNRKTASTGDLSKIQRARKTSSGTLERAQSLDITDTGITKSRKPAKFDERSSQDSSSEEFPGNIVVNKEPRLSLILDGLNTFQRSRLKKSTEWGNLEDAILNRSDSSENSETGERCETSIDNGDFDELASAIPAFDALVNKIKEIKQEVIVDVKENTSEIVEDIKLSNEEIEHVIKQEEDLYSHSSKILNDSSFVTDVMNAVTSLQHQTKEEPVEEVQPKEVVEEVTTIDKEEVVDDKLIKAVDVSLDLLNSERTYYDTVDLVLEDTNVSDDIKVSRHSLGNLEVSKFDIPIATTQLKDNISNITISDDFVERKPTKLFEDEPIDDSLTITYNDKILVSTPDLIKNVSIAEAIRDLNNEVTIEGPTSLTFEVNEKMSPEKQEMNLGVRSLMNLSNGSLKEIEQESNKGNSSLTYITEIQVTPNNVNNNNNKKNVSEVEVVASPKNLDNAFENFVKNFEASKPAEIQNIVDSIPETKTQITINEKIDPEKELHKIQEIVEEQLKKLPEMRFSTSSYEPSKVPEKRQSQIELLRSNFEKSPPKKPETTPTKSRIPIATSKTPPTSPERRDSRNLDMEVDKEIIEIMTSGIPSKYQPKPTSRNVTVTSIRNSKIPSGLPTYGNRPPVPPRKSDSSEIGVIQLSSNGNTENSFKQWVFNPSDSVTNISVTDSDTQK